MRHLIHTAMVAVLLAAPSAMYANDDAGKGDVTYGHVKEYTPGQKIVFDVKNAIDKSFDLTDKEVKVTVAAGLKPGDAVKITERTVNGKKTVHIAKHSGKEPQGAATTGGKAEVTYAHVKEITPGQKVVIDVDKGLDKTFDLTDKEVRVQVAKGLKAGDAVKVTEREVNGKKIVEIARHSKP